MEKWKRSSTQIIYETNYLHLFLLLGVSSFHILPYFLPWRDREIDRLPTYRSFPQLVLKPLRCFLWVFQSGTPWHSKYLLLQIFEIFQLCPLLSVCVQVSPNLNSATHEMANLNMLKFRVFGFFPKLRLEMLSRGKAGFKVFCRL